MSHSENDPDVQADPGAGDSVVSGPDDQDESRRGATATPRRRRRGPGVLTILGLVLILAGLSGFGWIAYQYKGTNAPSLAAATSEKSNLRSVWSQGQGAVDPPQATPGAPASAAPTAPAPVPDTAIALLRIPRLGSDYEVPILVGTSPYVLARGVGWYETTARPGQIGNFAVAGHRITHGEPFARLLELQVGDQVIVETKDYVYTYVIDAPPSKLTVQDVDSWVLDPVPGKKDVAPTQALITLTTCQDLFHSPDRSVGFGHLTTAVKK